MKMAKETKNDLRNEYDFSDGKRGRYVDRIHSEDTQPRNCKVNIMLTLDADIIDFFRKDASRRKHKSYKEQINSALRAFIDSEGLSNLSSLLNNELFIRAVAERVKEQ
jgi:uncharacterized protein (DUF4415 family)